MSKELTTNKNKYNASDYINAFLHPDKIATVAWTVIGSIVTAIIYYTYNNFNKTPPTPPNNPSDNIGFDNDVTNINSFDIEDTISPLGLVNDLKAMNNLIIMKIVRVYLYIICNIRYFLQQKNTK